MYEVMYRCLYSTTCMSTGIETCIEDVFMCVYQEVVSSCASPRVLAMYYIELEGFCVCIAFVSVHVFRDVLHEYT